MNLSVFPAISIRFLPLSPFAQGEEGGGESSFFVQVCLVVEVADGTLHPLLKCAYGRLRSPNGCARILHCDPSRV